MSEAPLESGAPPPEVEATSSFGMIASLGTAGAVAGFLIVGVFGLTRAPIEAHKAEVLRRAVGVVLHDPARYETRYVTSQGVVDEKAADAQAIYVGRDADDDVTGVAIEAAAAGFQDTITLIYGFDPASGELLGMKVLDNRETPGLGDRIEKDPAFVGQFEHATPPLEVVKRGHGAPGEIDAITGATISSRAVVRIINESLARVRAPIVARYSEASP